MATGPVTAGASEAEQLSLERSRLELEKLRAEIDEARLAWWKRPGYVGGLVPIVLATVGFLSAWITGYFDTQRENLKNEITTLEIERRQLESENQEIQRRIDDAYLRLKVAAGEARYAIGHVQGIPPQTTARERIEELAADAPDDLREALRNLLDRARFIDEIVDITADDLAKLDGTLAGIPASDWARALRYEPVPGQNILFAPDGRIYHLGDRSFYAPERMDQLIDRDAAR